MSLLDNIRKNITGAAEPVVQKDRTRQIEALQQGLTGRAATPDTGPRTSTIAEKVATAQAQQAQKQTEQAGQIQAEQLAGAEEAQTRQYNNQELATIEKALDVKQNYANQSDSIMGALERAGRELDMRRDGAKIEQLGFNIRLNNNEYLEQLQREGTLSRIDDQAQFEEELKRTIFSDELDALNSNLDLRRMIDADQREFMEMLSQIDIDSALDMARIDQQSFNAQQQAGALDSLLKAGIGAYGAYKNSEGKGGK